LRVQGSELCNDTDPYTYIPDTKPEPDTPSKCHYSCFKCDGPNRDDCLACAETDFRELVGPVGSKECKPIEEHFDKEPDSVAPKCHYHCKTCTGPNKN